MGILKYSSNNSGGSWWLKDKDWEALEAAGWNVHWRDKNGRTPKGLLKDPLMKCERTIGRFLGAQAKECAKEFETAIEGIEEWERITGKNARSLGCSCCGPPHAFGFKSDGNIEYFSPSAPEYGDW